MANVFVIRDDGRTEPMTRIRCANEDRELQLILEKNPDLLPGDQIDPDDPRRWLLIRREMPVPDPNTGSDRWSIDFLFADQDAVPTFVECKRFADTRSRREVVGQMFEYAANGHYYWTKELLRDFADEVVKRKGMSLDEAIRALKPGDESIQNSPEAFFERVQENLREGQVRIVFFMEESPFELRSVVDFLNKQMERTEVLLVEARQYSRNGSRIVVPALFGYTEEARQVKRSVKVTTPGNRIGASRRNQPWDEVSFFTKLAERNSEPEMRVAKALFEWGTKQLKRMDYGYGVRMASFIPVIPANENIDTWFCPFRVYTGYRAAYVEIPLGGSGMQAPPFDNPDQKLELVRRINSIPGVTIGDDLGRYPSIDLVKLAEGDRLERFLDAMKWAIEEVDKALRSSTTADRPPC